MKAYIFLLLSLICVGINAQNRNIPYTFPVKRGTEEWKAFKTGQQMLDACQIPEDILKELDTKALAETCMNFPLFGDFIYASDARLGLEWMIDNFNGLKELSQREDGTLELMKIYDRMDLQKEISYADTIPKNSTIHFNYIELLLSTDIFLSQLNETESDNLKNIALTKYEGKLKYNNIYGMSSIKNSLLIGAKILNKQKKFSESSPYYAAIQSFIKNFNKSDPALLQQVSKIIVESNEK